MQLGQETICYQHQQAQDILEKLLKSTISRDYPVSESLSSKLKEAIEYITSANDSAVKMEDKLKWYKQQQQQSGENKMITKEDIKITKHENSLCRTFHFKQRRLSQSTLDKLRELEGVECLSGNPMCNGQTTDYQIMVIKGLCFDWFRLTQDILQVLTSGENT